MRSSSQQHWTLGVGGSGRKRRECPSGRVFAHTGLCILHNALWERMWRRQIPIARANAKMTDACPFVRPSHHVAPCLVPALNAKTMDARPPGRPSHYVASRFVRPSRSWFVVRPSVTQCCVESRFSTSWFVTLPACRLTPHHVTTRHHTSRHTPSRQVASDHEGGHDETTCKCTWNVLRHVFACLLIAASKPDLVSSHALRYGWTMKDVHRHCENNLHKAWILWKH